MEREQDWADMNKEKKERENSRKAEHLIAEKERNSQNKQIGFH